MASPRRPGESGPEERPEEGGEAAIAAHWREEGPLPPPEGLRRTANVRDRALWDRFARAGFPDAFREFGDLLDWIRPFRQVFDGSRPPFYRWFVGGELNASANCLDRHLATRGDRVAIRFVPESERAEDRILTYRALHARVNELAALLREEAGVLAGDRVTLHLPMTPELPITMLACARLGAVHSVVFAGFSAEACGHRIADSGSRVLVTMDGFWRRGRWVDHRAIAHRASEVAAREGRSLERLLVWTREPEAPRPGGPTGPVPELHLAEALVRFRGTTVEPVPMPSEAPLFLMYTSGTTGRPKGAQHGTAGYLAYAAATTRLVLDVHPDDVYWGLADIGWITGHTYIVYGPLTLGATTILYEGIPDYPDADRPWRIAERLGVDVLYTSPTAIRQLRKEAPDAPLRHRLRFRVLGTVGEPIEPEAWRWYFDAVGGGRAAVVDTWWQTETGGILCSTVPALDPMKPGSAGPPLPGIDLAVLDEHGAPIARGSGRAGNLVVRAPWPGLMQTIWEDPDRFVATYFARYNRDRASRDWRDWPYFTGDGALEAADGYIRILGRIDDVINVAGHRLGSKEIESACLTVPGVAEAAVVPVLDPVRGRLPEVFVAIAPGAPDPGEVASRVTAAIEREIGKIARPRAVWVIADMPKTRSGKIMRRVLAALANGTDAGDITTLSDPAVVEEIRRRVAAGRSSSGSAPGPGST